MDGIRTEKTVDGVTTKYHLVGDKVTYEDNGTDKIYYSYDSNGKLISMNLNGEDEYYYIRNTQGDIIGLFDKDGTQIVSYTYDSWGKLVSTTGSLASTVGVKNPYRYRGYRFDSETELYYLQSRYYNAEWGRFINADGIIGQTGELLGHNLFAYCGNDPVNRIDPDGYLWGFIKEFFTQLTSAINSLKPVYATAGTAAIGDGPLPIGDVIGTVIAGGATIGAVGIAGYKTYKTRSTSSTKSKTKVVPRTNTKKHKSEYFAASTKKGGGINIKSPLTFTQAQTRVVGGKDVYAVSQLHAIYLAGMLGGTERGPDHPDIHKWSPDNKYHYHLKGHVGGHIFFDK